MNSRYSGTYLVTCDKELSIIRDLLNSCGPWEWTLRDNDDYGAYLIARPDASYTNIRLIGEHPPNYQLVTTYDPRGMEGPIAFESLHDTILDRLLPAIGARDVRTGPPWDS